MKGFPGNLQDKSELLLNWRAPGNDKTVMNQKAPSGNGRP
jgi:hypothetical protein